MRMLPFTAGQQTEGVTSGGFEVVGLSTGKLGLCMDLGGKLGWFR